jgi:ribonuclease Z
MSIQLVFLGTAGSVPTPARSLPAIIMKLQTEQIMFDCGEGVQRQMITAKVSFHKKMKIFITHMHGDHVLGLPGLLQTMTLMDRKKRLEIYGSEGIRQFMECVRENLHFGLTFPVEISEIYDNGIVCEEKEYIIEATKSNHDITSFAYAFVEKPRPGKFYPEKAQALGIPEGKLWSQLQHGNNITLRSGQIITPQDVLGPQREGRKIVYTGDTRPFAHFSKFAADADLVIHDSTFDDVLIEKAKLDGHSTPSQAGKQARKAKAKKLILTHISARYPDSLLLLKQAQKEFKNTLVAEDFMKLELPLVDH